MTPKDLSATAAHLTVHWADGAVSVLSAETLRAAARDAATLRQIHDTGAVAVAPDLTIAGVDYVGAYGVNIAFSDGHDRAIYPFVYLRELSGLTTS
ncbi:MAG: DUF971 domain-containing protein [Pseudomonadota bacterium]